MAGKKPSKREPIPALEWAAAAFGLAIAVALLTIIGRGALAGNGDEVPELVPKVERLFATGGGHVVEIRVENESSVTAAAVQVEGVIAKGRADEEVSTVTIDYVPGHSQSRGGLLFSRDPRGAGLNLRVTGYEVP